MANRPSLPGRTAPAGRASARIETATDLGRAIRTRRKELGHTQADTAALCRVGVRFLSELERGKPTAELGRALRVARRLGLELHLTNRSLDQSGRLR